MVVWISVYTLSMFHGKEASWLIHFYQTFSDRTALANYIGFLIGRVLLAARACVLQHSEEWSPGEPRQMEKQVFKCLFCLFFYVACIVALMTTSGGCQIEKNVKSHDSISHLWDCHQTHEWLMGLQTSHEWLLGLIYIRLPMSDSWDWFTSTSFINDVNPLRVTRHGIE